MIIVDTNVLLSFLLTKGITRKIIVKNKDVFIAPEYCFKELWEYKDKWNKYKLPDDKLNEIIEKVKKFFVMPVKEYVYKNALLEASKLIEDIDDAPVIALALSVDNEGIWTYNLKHFSTKKIKEKIKILSTDEVLRLYPI